MLLPLLSGAYSSRSVIANAQRCVNLYPEDNPHSPVPGTKTLGQTQPPVPVTHYPRPGKKLLAIPPVQGIGRGLYRATNGNLYAVVGTTLYYVDINLVFHALGNVTAGQTTPISFADNGMDVGNDIVVVDNTTNGWTINMTTNNMAALVDGTGTFVGATRVEYDGGFFVFNAPGTPYFYSSLLNSVSFNALDIASKSGYADNVATLAMRQREIWLIGQLTTEPWYLAGGAVFPFAPVASTFIPYGCVAPYSLASLDVSLCWLSQDLKGQGIAVMSSGYAVERISTHALEQEWQSYATLADAIAGTYQLDGHTFYVLHFPTANKSWAFDLATRQWHQQAWLDNDGNLNRDRATFYANAYGMVIAQDWQTGALYQLDMDTFTDNGQPILCVRGFPHVLDEMNRITHWRMVVDIQCGEVAQESYDPQLFMRYSDDRGRTFSDPLSTTMGQTGQFDESPQFTRLGMCRDRVYELSWAENLKTALNGVYVDDSEESET